jgi:integrase
MDRLTQKRLDQAVRVRDAQLASRLPYQRQLLRDHEVRGFTVIVHGESVVYQFGYRPRGSDPATGRRWPNRYVRIGDAGTHTLQEARDAARRLRLRVQLGDDPKLAAIQTRAIAAAASRQRITLSMRLPAYQQALQARGKSPRYQREELNSVRLTAAEGDCLDLLAEEITPPMLEGVLAACSPSARRARFTAFDRFLRWCLKGTDQVPATARFASFERPAAPPARNRVLTGPELAALWRAAEQAPSPVAADITRFLLSTPCRRGEAAALRWTDIDLMGRVWHQPTSKNGDPHDYPLNTRALRILLHRQDAGRAGDAGKPGYVFPGTVTASFSGWAHLIEGLRDAVDFDNWRPHDIRRSFVTQLAEQGVDEALLDLTINHRASGSRSGVRGVYQRSQRWAERVAALDAWNAYLDRQLGGG